MSDTWSDIQALKSRQSSMRERLARRKKEREGLVADITGQPAPASATATSTSSSSVSTSSSKKDDGSKTVASVASTSTVSSSITTTSTLQASEEAFTASKSESVNQKETHIDAQVLVEVENKLQCYLSDVTLDLPVDSTQAQTTVEKMLDKTVPLSAIEDLLQKFAAQQLIELESKDGKLVVISLDHRKLSALGGDDDETNDDEPTSKRRKTEMENVTEVKQSNRQVRQRQLKLAESNANKAESLELESLLSMESAKEKENKKLNDEILQLLSQPTAKEQSLVEKFRSQGGVQLKEFCQYGTTEECMKTNGTNKACDRLHFKKIIHKHTDESLGDCSFLNTCYHMDTCKYVHYTIDYPESLFKSKLDVKATVKNNDDTTLFPPQWVQCDLRKLDMAVLGKFSVIMADPPWDIHMELPYGTMSDDEMRQLPVPVLQDDGYIFLWVTGRAMELGRECLKLWGYDRIDELIWVKTNQLQRIIRTGRTGHWLNHGKEHCLIGRKGNPKNMNRGLDCDVLVAEVRATSHKPDEVYGMIERLSPGTRKIELFGRPHNVQPNWITLGNQLDGVKLLEPDVVREFKKRYPNGLNLT